MTAAPEGRWEIERECGSGGSSGMKDVEREGSREGRGRERASDVRASSPGVL